MQNEITELRYQVKILKRLIRWTWIGWSALLFLYIILNMMN